ncbi:MAG: exonuclease domain-containing protein [Gammaproteobacteria bacterium]|nr:exonuclease domain-containing protein [Gammaproteobacteria bacterium]
MITWPYWFGSPWYKHRHAPNRRHDGVMDRFYREALPLPNLPVRQVRFVALDLETTGLDPATDHILSIGLVDLDGLSVKLGSAWHEFVYTARDIPEQSAVIHRITDDTAATGHSIDELMPRLLDRLKGRVLVAHHAKLETGFLNKICQSLYGQQLHIPVIDTEVLARRQLQRRHQSIKTGSLRLFNLRQQYGLPDYSAHNALSDAIATAELFIAQYSDMCPSGNCRLKHFITG